MRLFRLSDEFTDPDLERALVAAVARQPGLYWELEDQMTPDVFTAAAQQWREVVLAIEAQSQPATTSGWEPAADPKAAAARLADLYQRRLLADASERLAASLYSERPATEVAALLEEEAARVQAALRQARAGQLLWAADLLPGVLHDAEERKAARIATGKPVMGLGTGVGKLDSLLGGLSEGLYILAGPPSVGKTTFVLQLAAAATQEAPVLYVTYENSPSNLTLKAIASGAGISPQQVQRGWADTDELRRAAWEWRPVGERLAFVEGTGQLTVAQVRAQALKAMNRHQAKQCLVVVDYIQLWAKAGGDGRNLSVRERVEVLGASLRELSMRLGSPVLAIASQNRAQGEYGNGKGAAALDSLKESGDLEYSADVVMFLTPAKGRTCVQPARAVDLTLAKNRNGDTGRVEMVFQPEKGILREETRS